MIYLHCGWPKTGTSSLQAALVRNQDRLTEAGILYPDKWRRGPGSHNALHAFLKASQNSDVAFDGLKRFFAAQDNDVLLSSEVLTIWLADDRRERLLELLATLQQLTPVRCIWTLRRFDEMACSLYQMLWRSGSESISPVEFMGSFNLNPMGFLQVEDVVAEVAYVKYASTGSHNSELLREFGVPVDVAGAIEADIRAGPRRNVSLSHKQAVAVLHVEALSARAGIDLERVVLLDAFRTGGLRFDDDRRWEPVNGSVRRSLHERMLQASLDCGFESYPRFFGDVTIGDSASSGSMDPDALDDGDMSRLLAYLQEPASA